MVKKIGLFIGCLMLIMLVGCSSSDPKSLVGKWEDFIGSKTEFRSDGKFIHRAHPSNNESNNKLIEGTYRVENGILVTQYSLDGNPVTLREKYKIINDVLKLMSEDGETKAEYKKVLKFSDEK